MPEDVTREVLKAPGAALTHNSIDFKPRQLQLDTWWEALSTIPTAAETFICLIRQLHTFRGSHTLAVHHCLLHLRHLKDLPKSGPRLLHESQADGF